MNLFLKHSYTWLDDDTIPVLDEDDNPTYDSNGIPITTDPAQISEKPCLFLWEDIPTETPQGTITQHSPTLYVPHDDPITEGDLVIEIIDAELVVILSSARVLSIDTTAETGSPVMKVCRLSGART